MKGYILSRILQGLILLFLVSAVVFTVIHAAPGGPALLNQPDTDPKLAQELAEQLGLTDPIPVQYARWLRNLLRGSLGKSYQHNLPTYALVVDRIPKTLLLSGVALLIAVLLAIPLGITSAVYRHSAIDALTTVGAFFGVSIPIFWLGIMLIIFFSVQLKVLPSSGMITVGAESSVRDLLSHLIMPALVLSTYPLAQLTRYVRSSMVDVLAQDYIRTARGKGLPEKVTLLRHGLRNALIPVITVLGVITPQILSGAVITETIFAWPGLGRLAVDSAITRDYPVIMGVSMLASTMVILSNLLTDVLYVAIDPRITLR
ncbi:MAG: ABC transporter permease [Armatimonadetes bacterium]|nr:ABC transporter permease [Armatimonadota bacterium]